MNDAELYDLADRGLVYAILARARELCETKDMREWAVRYCMARPEFKAAYPGIDWPIYGPRSRYIKSIVENGP